MGDRLQKMEEEAVMRRKEEEEQEEGRVGEIHQALKLLNGNIGKVSQDSKDRYEMLKSEMAVWAKTVEIRVEDLRNKGEVD